MSVLTQLTAARLEVNRLLGTRCAKCGHRLANHSLISDSCRGHWSDSPCRCKGFVDPGAQLELK